MEKFKKVLSIVLFVSAIIISFVFGYLANDMSEKLAPELNPFENIQSIKQTSVSVTDRGELLVIKRTNGETIVLDNEVGMSIFKVYAASIYKENTK